MTIPVNTYGGANTLGLPLNSVPLVDPSTGRVSTRWWPFFNNLYARIGGPSAPSNDEIQNVINNPTPIYFGDDGDYSDTMFIPGVPGLCGTQGTQGMPGLDGQDGEDSAMFGSPVTQDMALNTLRMGGKISPSTTEGIVGTTLANNAVAGRVGENITPTNILLTAMTTATPINLSSVVLTPGDYDVTGCARFLQAAATTGSNFVCGLSTTSATFAAAGTYAQFAHATPANADQSIPTPSLRFNVSSNTTVYLVAQATFAVSTMVGSGYLTITRRRR